MPGYVTQRAGGHHPQARRRLREVGHPGRAVASPRPAWPAPSRSTPPAPTPIDDDLATVLVTGAISQSYPDPAPRPSGRDRVRAAALPLRGPPGPHRRHLAGRRLHPRARRGRGRAHRRRTHRPRPRPADPGAEAPLTDAAAIVGQSSRSSDAARSSIAAAVDDPRPLRVPDRHRRRPGLRRRRRPRSPPPRRAWPTASRARPTPTARSSSASRRPRSPTWSTSTQRRRRRRGRARSTASAPTCAVSAAGRLRRPAQRRSPPPPTPSTSTLETWESVR